MAKTNKEKIYENLKSIEEWAFAGVSQKEMAAMLGMSYSSFRDLKKEISALSAIFKKSAEGNVADVEASLFKRCLGYNATVKKVVKVKKALRNDDGRLILVNGKPATEETLEEVEEEQHVPADVGAMKFYLMNMAKKVWKNDPERLALEKKRVANDTKRTKIAENSANGQSLEGKTIEDYLEEAEGAAESTHELPKTGQAAEPTLQGKVLTKANLLKEGGTHGEDL